jgi:membrane protease subunit HflK
MSLVRGHPLPYGKITLGLVILVYVLSGTYTVKQDEEAVVLLFGKPWKTRVPSGIHYAPPRPFGKRQVVRTATAYQMSVGFKLADSVRGLPPSREETEFLTGDTNILDLEMILQYTIDDPLAFGFQIEDPHFLVRRTAEAVATRILARTPVDTALTSGRSTFLEKVRRETQEILRTYGTGIVIVSSTIKRIEPPAEVIAAFQDVQNAKADKEKSINQATGYANEILPRARGEAGAMVSAAEADREAWVEMARGDAEGIRSMVAEYRLAPAATRDRMYLETAEKVLHRATVYVIDAGGRRSPMGLKLIE